ncbi:hypothetical protein Tco_0847460 [Tanacetum coccineum]
MSEKEIRLLSQPMNKDKKVRFVELVTSSSNIPKQTDSLKTKDSNKPLLTSTGVNTTTSASGSKPSGNTKKHSSSSIGYGVFVMEKKDGLNMKVGIATRVNLEESGAKCDVSPKLCNSSHLVSPTTTINMPRGLYNIDVAPTFRVPLTTIDALGVICNSIKVDNTNADVIPCKAVDINTMSTSYARAAGVSAKDQPKVNSNFRPLVDDPIFDGVNIFIPYKVVKKAGLEAILEGGPWLIQADLVDIATIDIPLLTGDDFTKETIRVKYEWRPPRCDLCKIFGHVHDHCPNKVVCPPIVTTSNVVTPTIEKTNNGFQTMSKKKKRKSKSKLQMVVSLPVHRLNKRLDMSQM